MSTPPTNRIWQIDALRGSAVIGMVIYHFAFALFFFGGFPIPIFHWSWELFQTLVAGTFLVLVGYSLRLSWQRQTDEGKGSKEKVLSVLLRGIKVFGMGLVITVATWMFLPGMYVRFGVLHLIGASLVLALPLLRWPRLATMLGTGILLLPLLVTLPPGNIFTLWLGFVPQGFRSLDYFPAIPWFGLVLIGTWLASWIHFPSSDNPVPWLGWIGRHALAIYMLHQPIVIGIVFLLERVSPWS